jgi:hypothetical protein
MGKIHRVTLMAIHVMGNNGRTQAARDGIDFFAALCRSGLQENFHTGMGSSSPFDRLLPVC